jgi:hypothetical protein
MRSVRDLDADLRHLVDLAAPGVEPPASAKERVAQQLVQSLAAMPVIGPAGTARGSTIRNVSGTSLAKTGIYRLAHVVGALVIGGVAGVAGHAALDVAKSERIVYVERAVVPDVSADPPAAASASETPVLEPMAAPAEKSPRRTKTTVVAPPSRASDLEAERTLLDTARRALAGGRSEDVLQAVDDHLRRFPEGLLVEEREALAINALVLASRGDEARERAGRFVQRFPNSLLRPSVDAAIATIP